MSVDRRISLNCPACGSPMSSPDAQGVADCPSCHTRVIVPQSDSAKEHVEIAKYAELLEEAGKVSNFADMLKYSNAILELDPKNRDAWIGKAKATSMLTTEDDDRFPEALGYLEQVRRLYPDYHALDEYQKEIENGQLGWYIRMAHENNVRAGNYLIAMNSAPGIHHTVEAMNFYMKALRISPDDMKLLKSFQLTASSGTMIGITWKDEVKERLNSYDWLLSKQAAPKKLAELYKKLDTLKAKLPQLEQKHGLFAKANLEDALIEIRRLEAEVKRWQAAADYQPPK